MAQATEAVIPRASQFILAFIKEQIYIYLQLSCKNFVYILLRLVYPVEFRVVGCPVRIPDLKETVTIFTGCASTLFVN